MKQIFRSFQFVMAVLVGVATAGSLEAQFSLIANPSTVALTAQSGSTVPVPQMIAVTSSGDASGNHIQFSAFVSVPSGQTWLTLTGATSGTTPGAITLAANPTNLASGSYTGTILIFASSNNANNSPLNIPVTFTIGQLSAHPAALTFAYQSGGSVPPSQSIAVSGPSTPVGFTAAASVASGTNWLQVAPTSGTTPAMISASLNPTVITGLAAGTYNGSITLTPTSGQNAPLVVPVTLTVTTASQLTATPASLSFLYQIGGTNNVLQQDVSLTSSGGPVTLGAPQVNQSWLVATATGSVTPATVTVGLQTASLTQPGTFMGAVTIAITGTSHTLTIPVTVLVSNNPLLTFTRTSLSFAYLVGGPAPTPQSITPSSTGAAVNYTATATTSGGGSWLAVTSSGTTPTPLVVGINPAVLPPVSQMQTFTGTITITAAGAGNSPQQIPVTLTVSNTEQLVASPTTLTFLYQIGKTVPAVQTVTVTGSEGAALDYTGTASTMSGGTWLSVAPTTGTTPGTFNVTATTTGLAAGTYTGTVTITAANHMGPAINPVNIPVTFYVSDNALLKVCTAAVDCPTSLAFVSEPGGPLTAQTIYLTGTNDTSDRLNYTITFSTVTGGPWLAVSSQPGMTPGNFPVTAVPGGLATGTYSGSITITAVNPGGPPVDDSPVTIPVTLTVASGTLSAMPTSLAFAQPQGDAAPPSQSISVTGTGPTPLNFVAVATTNTGVNWLTVTPAAGTTPATLTVSANGASLSQGTYTGTVTITAPGAAGSPKNIMVTLTIGAPTTITVAPATLSFSAQVGSAAPAAQTVQVTSNVTALAFTAAAATSGNSGNWLSVTPASGTAPATLSVSVSPGSLAAGTYTGTVTVTATGAGISPQTVNVTFSLTPPPMPVVMLVENAASYAVGPVAPGGIVAIFGTNFGGPTAGALGVITGHSLGTTLADTQLLFDNIAAPLLYVSDVQINAVVPFELFGRFQTHLQVVHAGVTSATLDLNVVNAAPGIFTANQSGSGQGSILNPNFSVNSAGNPVAQGSYLMVYGTGGGQTAPPGVTGNITPGDGTGLKDVPGVTATVGGKPATVLYAGTAPGFVEGALQVNVQLPATLGSGPQPITIAVNGVSSQTGVMVAVR